MLGLCEVITQRFLNVPSDEKTDLFPLVHQFWYQISKISNVCIPSVLKAAADDCASLKDFWFTLYELFSLLYTAGKGTSILCSKQIFGTLLNAHIETNEANCFFLLVCPF